MCDKKKETRPTNAAAGGPGSRTGGKNGNGFSVSFPSSSILPEQPLNVKRECTALTLAASDCLSQFRRNLENQNIIEVGDPLVWQIIQAVWESLGRASYLSEADKFAWSEESLEARRGFLLP